MQQDNLEPFINSALLARLKSGPDGSPADTRFDGAVLFADISGYTTLCERLCESGAEGLEALALLLDQAFGSYLNAVDATGGEIGCIAGDALLAYWPTGANGFSEAIIRAERCARMLHDVSETTPVAGYKVPRLHIGLSAGPLWAAWLGGIDGRWLPLLAGEAVRDACEACKTASVGQTHLSTPALALSRSNDSMDSGQPRNTGLHNGSGQEDLQNAVKTYRYTRSELSDLVPRVVREMSDSGTNAWLPMLRNVSTLFVRIGGLDEKTPDALERHQAAIAALLTAARHYSGSSGTLVLDDKGLVFTLCLGLPHDAHKDDSARAVKAGLAIEAALHDVGLNCSAGVAAGRAVCTAIGSSRYRQYLPIGRSLHVAARLMQEADSGLLCTYDIAETVCDEIDMVARPPIQLKGIAQPIELFRAHGTINPDDSESLLLDREVEKRVLTRNLDALGEGGGAVLQIYGDAGMGKTALVDYLVTKAANLGINCLLGGARSAEHAVSYMAWRPIFADLLGVHADDPAATVSSDVVSRLTRELPKPELAPLINAVLPGLLEETTAVAGLSGQARGATTLDVLSKCIRGAVRQPFLLIMEDCHWMDSASWKLIARIVEECPRVLVVMTSRPVVEGPELQVLKRREDFAEMTLTPLSKDSVGRLVRGFFDKEAVAPEIIDEVSRRSGGNPLFAREYTLLLRASGRLINREGEWRLARARISDRAAGTLPLTVEGTIASRLDSLPGKEELVVRAASVLGDQFELALLRRLLPEIQVSVDDLDDVLARLMAAQLVHRTDQTNTLAFRHGLIREAAYTQLTPNQKQTLHRAAAIGLESLHAHQLVPYYATLALHWSKTTTPASAVKYADLAAAHALASGAYLEADQFLRMCLDLAEHKNPTPRQTSTRIHWHVELAEASQGLGRVEERGAEARRALALAGCAQPQHRIELLFRTGARAIRAYSHGRYQRDVDVSDRTLALDLARAYRHSAAYCFFSNDPVAMVCDTVAAVEWAQAVAPCADQASAYAELGGLLGIAGLRRIGEQLLGRAVELGNTTGDGHAKGYAHLINSLYAVGVGDWRMADDSAIAAQDQFLPLGDRVNWANAQAVRFWLNYYQARNETAESIARELQERAHRTGNRQHQAWALRFLALCDLRRREPEPAAELLENALECLGDSAALNDQIPTLGALALARLRMGRVSAARATVTRGLDLVGRIRLPLIHSTIEGYAALTEVALEGWREALDTKNWRREARRAIRGLRRYRYAFPIGDPYYRLWCGHYLELSGRSRAAGRSFRRGRDAAAKLGMRDYETRCKDALRSVSAVPESA